MTEFLIRWDPNQSNGDTLRAWGRNGMSKCAGIHLRELGKRVIVRPLNGDGQESRSVSIELPDDPETLRDLAGTLSAIAGGIETQRSETPAVSPGETR